MSAHNKRPGSGRRLLACIALAIAGLFTIGAGLGTVSDAQSSMGAIDSLGTGSTESSETYGGDAYTGIQNASAQAANNIVSGNMIAREAARATAANTRGVGQLIVAVGVFELCLGIYLGVGVSAGREEQAVPASAPAPSMGPNPASAPVSPSVPTSESAAPEAPEAPAPVAPVSAASAASVATPAPEPAATPETPATSDVAGQLPSLDN